MHQRNFIITFFYNQFRRLPCPKDDLTGKTVIVTGANVGLGLEAARHFVRLKAAKVILGCRSAENGERARADIERSTGRKGIVEVWPLDLCSFESVRQFCRRADRLDRLDVVVENAAVAMVDPQGTLAEGYECTVTVNVISTFLMALMLLPTLRRTAMKFNLQPRLVIVSSDAHFMVSPRFVDLSCQWCSSVVRLNGHSFHRPASTKGRHTAYSTPSNQP